MPKAIQASQKPVRRRAPATTLEDREDRMIAMAVDLAEQRLMDGTATPQMILHYLRLGSTRERLEKEKLEKENELLRAKTRAIESGEEIKVLYQEALKAMKDYAYEGN